MTALWRDAAGNLQVNAQIAVAISGQQFFKNVE